MSLQEIKGTPFQKKMSSQPSIKQPSPKKTFTKKDNPLQRIINRDPFVKTPSVEEPSITESTPLSKQQVQTQTGRNWLMGMRESILTREKTRMMKGRIKPEEQYVMQEEGPSWSKGQVLTGTQVRGLYDTVGTEQSLSSSRYLRGTGQLLKTVSSLPAGSLFYPEDAGFIVATPEAQELLGFYKSRGYKSPGGDIGFYRSPPKPTEVLTQVKGTSGKIAMASLDIMFPFIVPFNWAAEAITGEPYLERHGEQQASRVLELMPGQGEQPASYLPRQLSSPEAILGVYLPVITFGASTAAGYLGRTLTESAGARYLSYLGSKNLLSIAGKSLTIRTTIKGGLLAGIGGYTGLQIYQHPEQTPTILGSLTSVFAISSAASIGGTALGRSLAYKPGLNWTGTAYEGYVTELSRRASILESQYTRPFEWGAPSTHYTTAIAPIYAKIPYIPKHPSMLHTVTRGYIDPLGSPQHSFIFNRPLVSKRMFSYDIETPSVEPGVSILTGRFIPKRGTSQLTGGYSYSEYTMDIGDISVYRTFTKSFKGDISHGTLLSKNIPAGSTSIPGRYGLITTETPYDLTYTISRSLGRHLDVFNLGKHYRNVPVLKDYFGSSMGFDTTGVTVLGRTDQLYLPGGTGLFSEQSMFPSLTKMGGFPRMTKGALRNIAWSDVDYVSSFWDASRPMMGTRSSSLTRQITSSVLSSKNLLASIPVLSFLSVSASRQMQHSMKISSSVLSQAQQSGLRLSDVLTTSSVVVSHGVPQSMTQMPLLSEVLSLSVPSSVSVPYAPFIPIPIIPWGGKTSGEGGGYGRGGRKKRGARRRTHPTELYDLLQVKVAI